MNRQEAYLDALAAMRTALHHAPKVGPATRVPLCHYNDKPGTAASGSAVVFSAVPQVMYRADRIYATGWTPTHLRIEGRAVELAPEEGAPRACFVPKVPETILPGLLLELVGERKEGARNTPKVLASGTILGDDGKPHAAHLGLRLCNELREFEGNFTCGGATCLDGCAIGIELRLTQGGQALRLFVIVEGGSAEDLYLDDLKIGRDSLLIADASIPVVLVPHGVFLPEVFVYPGCRLMVWMRNRGAEPARVRFELGMRPILEDSPLDGVNTAPPEGAPLE